MTFVPTLRGLNRFLPVLCLCFGLLLLVPPVVTAQGLFGGSAGDLSAPLRSYLRGGSDTSLGVFSAGYDYYSFKSQGTVGFNELKLGYQLPIRIGRWAFVTPYAIGNLTDIKDSPQTFGLGNTVLRFGGAWLGRLHEATWVGAWGEYDATRRQGTWYSGGQVAIEMYQFVCGQNLGTLRVKYYTESAGDQIIFPTNPYGYEGTIGYSHELFYCGPRLVLNASVYDFYSGLQDKQRGWYAGADVMLAQGILTLKGTVGQDSTVLDNYTVGAFVNLAF